MATEGRIERWKKANRTHIQRYNRNYYRERQRALLEGRLAKARKGMETADGPRLHVLELEAKELKLKLDRLRLQERNEKGAA